MGDDHEHSDNGDYSGQSSRYDDYDYESDCEDGHKGKRQHKSRRSHHRKKDCDETISPGVAFVIWLVVLIILIWVLRAAGIRWFSSVAFGLLVATCILCMVYPCHFDETGRLNLGSKDSLFAFITFITLVVFILWIFWKVFTDRDDWYMKFCQRYADGNGNGNGWWSMWGNSNANASAGNPGY